MKRCPTCNRTYADLSLNFCLDDGTPLTSDAATTADLNATIRYPAPRDTSEPPPTEIYRPAPTAAPPPRPTPPPPLPQPQPQPQWSPTPALPAKKSNAVWWILSVVAVLVVIGGGLVVGLVLYASLGANNNIRISNVNNSNSNISANTNANANANVSVNANVGPPSSLVDDFSLAKWNTATSQFGKSWYADGEYHMSSKDQTFIVNYAPSNDYSSENATVKVTARSVSGNVPSAGFGLMVHCLQSRSGQLEDYALLIYPSDEPEFEIIMHKGGNQSTLVERTKSNAIKSGAEPNELQIKIKGTQMTFMANGRVLTQMTDKENYRKGRVGLYTSDVYEVAFDDLSIERTP